MYVIEGQFDHVSYSLRLQLNAQWLTVNMI